MIVRRLVRAMGFRYRLHVRSLPGSPDLVMRGIRKAIFVHGCFWHGHTCPRGERPSSNKSFWVQKIAVNQGRDLRARKLLRAEGWSLLTLWECELKELDVAEKKLVRFLTEKRSKRKVH
jgi:DNA mismatch endonuclease (patch repair protein)